MRRELVAWLLVHCWGVDGNNASDYESLIVDCSY